jgi:hypothetical protein
MKNKISFVTNRKFYSKELSNLNLNNLENELLLIIENLNNISKINYFVFQDNKLKVSFAYNEFENLLKKYSIKNNPILKGNKLFSILHNSIIVHTSGIDYNESYIDNIKIYKINLFDIYATGEWYDGSTIDDGVPYFEGTVEVTNITNNELNSIDFDNDDADQIAALIIDILHKDYEFLNIDDFAELIFDKLSSNLVDFDEIKLVLNQEGNILAINGKGTGKWTNISEFLNN